MSLFNALYLFDLPTNTHRLLHSLSRDGDLDQFWWIVIRMGLIWALVAIVRLVRPWIRFQIQTLIFPKAYISATDPAYQWVTAWISQDPDAQRQIHDFQLSTAELRHLRKKSSNALHAPSGTNKTAARMENATWVSKEIIGKVMPTYHHSVRIKHNGNYLWITRKMGHFARSTLRTVDHIQVQTIAFQANAIKNFLIAAHQAYFAKEDQELLIFHPKRINPTWQLPVSRPARPWSSVILPEDVKGDLLRDMERFLSEKETSWYAARGIPHRRGYLFHGDPGAGKTTLTTALASKLALDIYVINPSQRGMDDAKLSKLFRDCPARSIILIEDIDCIFPRSRAANTLATIDGPTEDGDSGLDIPDESEVANQPVVRGNHDLAPSTVTMSGLLNAIDGVSSQEGCILIASTNHPDRLDPALSRAGRFDVQVPFSNAIPAQARALFLHFYPLSEFLASKPANISDYADEKCNDKGITSQADLDALADRFASAVFPHEGDPSRVGGREGVKVSMAALQGYLLRYKEDPMLAAESAAQWAGSLDEDQGGMGGMFSSSLARPPPSPSPAEANASTDIKPKSKPKKIRSSATASTGSKKQEGGIAAPKQEE